MSSAVARGLLCVAICLLATLAGPAGQSPAPGQAPAQPAAAEQPAVKPNAFRTLPAVPLYSGPAPLRADWPGTLEGEIKEVASQNGEVLYNVVDPSYTAFLPEPGRNTGTPVLVANHTSDLFIDQFFAWMQAQGLTRKPGDPDRRPRGRGMGPGRGRGGV